MTDASAINKHQRITLQALTDENLIKLSNGQVKSGYDYNLTDSSNPPIMSGLFDHRIFGAINRCYCGRTSVIGSICPNCGARIVSREEAEERNGHYILNYPYVSKLKVDSFIKELIDFNPIFNKLLYDGDGKKVSSTSQSAKVANLYRIKFIYIPITEKEISEGDLVVKDSNGLYKIDLGSYSDSGEDSKIGNFGPSAFRKLIRKYSLHHSVRKSWEFIDKYVNQVVIVPPTTMRPAIIKVEADGKKVLNLHPMNLNYKAMILMDQSLNKVVDSLKTMADKLAAYYSINMAVDFLQESFSIIATSKVNLVRNKLSQIVKKTGRANIVGDPNLPIDTLLIPRSMAYESLKSDVINALRNKGIKNPLEEYANKKPETEKLFEDIVAQSCVLYLRNPSLYKYNVTAFKVGLTDDIAIHMGLSSTKLFNADKKNKSIVCYIRNYVKTKTVNCWEAHKYWVISKLY